MSVYLPRSAVSPTISGRWRPSSTSALPNGAATAVRLAASSRPIAWVKARSTMARLRLIELVQKRIPFAGVDLHEVRLFTLLQRRHPSAGLCPEHYGMWSVAPPSRSLQRRDDRSDVIAIDLLGLPAEGPPFSSHRLHVQHDGAIGLDAVAVDQRNESVQLEMGGRHRRLPGRALLHLAVGQFAEGACFRPARPQAERHTD